MIKDIHYITGRGMVLVVDLDSDFVVGDEIDIYTMYGIPTTRVTIAGIEGTRTSFGKTKSPIGLLVIGVGTSREDFISKKYIDIGSSIIKIRESD